MLRCEIKYANAKSDPAVQQQQVDSMITKKVDVIILDSVDSKSIAGSVKKAAEANIPVVAYDRLAEGPVSAYTVLRQRDGRQGPGRGTAEGPGRQGQGRQDRHAQRLGGRPQRRHVQEGRALGPQGQGGHRQVVRRDRWLAEEANKAMTGAISSVGKSDIIGVYSANDSMAGGAKF